MGKDRYGEALGLWHIKVDGADFDIKLQMGDGRELRNLLVENTKDKIKLFDLFTEFMVKLIKRQYPEDDTNRIKEYVEFNCMKIFEEAQVTFRFTTREELEKAKSESLKEIEQLKKSI
jgi:16S rRNA C967 or C1407 C5-methylase (RsmB/RsmF family)